MQKKLIALAVAAALAPAAAMADTTLYGRVHVSVDNLSGTSRDGFHVSSSSSRLGVKGSENLDYGLKGLYQLETGINAVNNNPNTALGGAGDGNPGDGQPGNTLFTGMRTSYIGLASDFGTFLIGRLPAGEQYVYDSNLFADQVGDAANILSGGTAGYIGGRANGALHYVSPSFNGFDVALTVLPGTSVNSTTGGTGGSGSFGVRANYAAMGAEVHVTYFDVKAGNVPALNLVNGELKPLSIAGSYDLGAVAPAKVVAQFVRNSLTDNGNTKTQNMYNIGGTYKVMPNGTVKLQYTMASDTTGNTDGGSQIAVGFDYDLSKRTSVYVAYAQVTNNAGAAFKANGYGHGNSVTVGQDQDPSAISFGVTHNF